MIKDSQNKYLVVEHFRHWLLAMSKSPKEVPKEIVDVIEELKKYNSTNKVDVAFINSYIQKNNLRDFYEYKLCILQKVYEIDLSISKELENEIVSMYKKILVPSKKHHPGNAHLPYIYVLYKFLQLLDQTHLINCILVLFPNVNKEYYSNCEIVFDKVCLDLGWQFIPM